MACFTKWHLRLENRAYDADIRGCTAEAGIQSMYAVPEATGYILQDRHGLQLSHQVAHVQAA